MPDRLFPAPQRPADQPAVDPAQNQYPQIGQRSQKSQQAHPGGAEAKGDQPRQHQEILNLEDPQAEFEQGFPLVDRCQPDREQHQVEFTDEPGGFIGKAAHPVGIIDIRGLGDKGRSEAGHPFRHIAHDAVFADQKGFHKSPGDQQDAADIHKDQSLAQAFFILGISGKDQIKAHPDCQGDESPQGLPKEILAEVVKAIQEKSQA